MASQSIISQAGPLPIKVTFNAPLDGPATIFLSGSAWSNVAAAWVGVQMQIDNALVGSAFVFCNEASSHRALIPNFFTTNLSDGAHTVTLVPLNGNTQADSNDGFYVTLLY